GHIMVRARGPIMTGLGEGNNSAEEKRGIVWRGGVSLVDLPFYVVLRKDDKSARVAHAVAERVNFLFQDDPQRLQRLSVLQKQLFLLDDVANQVNRKTPDNVKLAATFGKETVQVHVPYNYRLNAERYFYVLHLVPLAEDAEQQGRYRRRLQKLLADPAETVMAARRLEAMGRDSIPLLKSGLTHEHPLVRFASAEALAYLGDPTGVEDLATLAVHHPLLTTGCLTALAGLDERTCRQRLSEML